MRRKLFLALMCPLLTRARNAHEFKIETQQVLENTKVFTNPHRSYFVTSEHSERGGDPHTRTMIQGLETTALVALVSSLHGFSMKIVENGEYTPVHPMAGPRQSAHHHRHRYRQHQ